MHIEKPVVNQKYIKPDETKLTLSGWAVANDTNAKIQIFLDGNIITPSITRLSRTDVDKSISPSYGGTKETPKAGFQTIIDVSNYSAGIHTIKVRELSRYNEILCDSGVNFIIENKKYIRKNAYRKAHSKSKLYKTR